MTAPQRKPLGTCRIWVLGLFTLALLTPGLHGQDQDRPNILFCLADDQSFPHASTYGEPVIKTPVFDRIAREGVLFTQAYCAAPSCTPSRSAILTGQAIWRLEQGGQLFGTLPVEHPVYTDLLSASGYHVGYMDKGWSPGNERAGGRTSNLAGARFKNFQDFVSQTPWDAWPYHGYNQWKILPEQATHVAAGGGQ
ncbi:MAG: sulfatase-like hydrolase/transferase [Planctomycetes bacterium]|nr:sulfatase-like hydrolase/transferase [Planctomycetota bacterium]